MDAAKLVESICGVPMEDKATAIVAYAVSELNEVELSIYESYLKSEAAYEQEMEDLEGWIYETRLRISGLLQPHILKAVEALGGKE